MSTPEKLAIREWLLEIVKQLWPAYLLASLLILCGFQWSLPSTYQDKSFQADENGAVWAVNQIHFPHLNPHWFAWGTGLFYQVYLLRVIFTVSGLFPSSDYWMLVIGRLVVFASAMGVITALVVLARKMFDPWTAQLAAILLPVMPGFVINAHYFKTDVPMTFWMLVTMVAAYQLIETGAPRDVLLLGLLVGYTASIKYSAGDLLFDPMCASWPRPFPRGGQENAEPRWMELVHPVGACAASDDGGRRVRGYSSAQDAIGRRAARFCRRKTQPPR